MNPHPILAVRWWCCRVHAPWTWAWHPYIGVWILLAIMLFLYERSWRKHDEPSPECRRRTAFFVGGMFFLWAGSDWPLGTLGASYLASIHMVDYVLYVVAAAPMFVLATPEWMARRAIQRMRLGRVMKIVTRPAIAVIIFNVALVGTHAPVTVDTLRSTPGGSFFLDMVWLVSGIIAWTPVCSTVSEFRIRSEGLKCLYLWLAIGVVCTVPSAFLIFAQYPLYRSFELAPRVFGLNALTDQRIAGLVMKFGPMPVILAVITTVFMKWFTEGQKPTPRPAVHASVEGDQEDREISHPLVTVAPKNRHESAMLRSQPSRSST